MCARHARRCGQRGLAAAGVLSSSQKASSLGASDQPEECSRMGTGVYIRVIRVIRGYSAVATTRLLALNTNPRGRGYGFDSSACCWIIMARWRASSGEIGSKSSPVRRLPTIFTPPLSAKPRMGSTLREDFHPLPRVQLFSKFSGDPQIFFFCSSSLFPPFAPVNKAEGETKETKTSWQRLGPDAAGPYLGVHVLFGNNLGSWRQHAVKLRTAACHSRNSHNSRLIRFINIARTTCPFPVLCALCVLCGEIRKNKQAKHR